MFSICEVTDEEINEKYVNQITCKIVKLNLVSATINILADSGKPYSMKKNKKRTPHKRNTSNSDLLLGCVLFSAEINVVSNNIRRFVANDWFY